MTANQTSNVIRNSLLDENDPTADGSGTTRGDGRCFLAEPSNNVGGVHVLTAPDAANGSRVDARYKILIDEHLFFAASTRATSISEWPEIGSIPPDLPSTSGPFAANRIHRNLIRATSEAALLNVGASP